MYKLNRGLQLQEPSPSRTHSRPLRRPLTDRVGLVLLSAQEFSVQDAAMEEQPQTVTDAVDGK
jgi:hypothetical protein